jgi:hypothetical protein
MGFFSVFFSVFQDLRVVSVCFVSYHNRLRYFVTVFLSHTRFVFDKASHNPGLSAPLQLKFGSLRLLAYFFVVVAKIAVEREENCECDSHTVQQAQPTASHCRLISPRGELLFTHAQWDLFWLAAKLHQGHATDSRDIQNGRILSGQNAYYLCHSEVVTWISPSGLRVASAAFLITRRWRNPES